MYISNSRDLQEAVRDIAKNLGEARELDWSEEFQDCLMISNSQDEIMNCIQITVTRLLKTDVASRLNLTTKCTEVIEFIESRDLPRPTR